MAKLTNIQKNQLIYYKPKGRQYKNEEITPKYLDNLLSSYRELMRPNKTLEKETNDAKLLEQVLNGIKQYQNNQVDSKNYSLEDIVADAALNNLLLNLKEVNPHLFEGAGLITSSTDKVAQGAMLEDFMNEFITTVNAAFQGINFDSGDMIYRTGGMLDAINNKNLIQDIGNDVMQQTIDKFNKVINIAAFKSGKIIDNETIGEHIITELQTVLNEKFNRDNIKIKNKNNSFFKSFDNLISNDDNKIMSFFTQFENIDGIKKEDLYDGILKYFSNQDIYKFLSTFYCLMFTMNKFN